MSIWGIYSVYITDPSAERKHQAAQQSVRQAGKQAGSNLDRSMDKSMGRSETDLDQLVYWEPLTHPVSCGDDGRDEWEGTLAVEEGRD
jgi:hypothetical protein